MVDGSVNVIELFKQLLVGLHRGHWTFPKGGVSSSLDNSIQL